MSNYIPKELLDAIALNQLVIFVGSGFSKPLGFLDWRQLAYSAIKEFKEEYPQVTNLKDCLDSDSLDEILVFDALRRLNAEKIESVIKNANNLDFDKTKLVNHRSLWEISRKIITTNYDKTLEVSMLDHTIETICNNHEYEVGKKLGGEGWLFHIHGKVDDIRNCVIFSKDYHRLYNNTHPSIEQLKAIVQNQSLLFIGFSMRDKYVTNLFNNLSIIFNSSLNTNHFILLSKNEDVANSNLRKIFISDYNKVPDFLVMLKQAKTQQFQSSVKVTRYNRRRCRSFVNGSPFFNTLLKELLCEPVSHDSNDIQKIYNDIELLDEYEKCISSAVLNENLGNIEEAIKILEAKEFQGEKEHSRVLYLALAYEKIDFLKKALDLLDKIVGLPFDNEITISAKFNRNVCFEKLALYEKVQFEYFINSDVVLEFTKEKIRDKAIANELIICHKTGKLFKYEELLKQELENSFKNHPKSYCKSLINYLMYKNQSISKEKYDEILALSKKMSVNSRVGILSQVYKSLDSQTKKLIKDELLAQLEYLTSYSNSTSTSKHFDELKKYMDEY